MLETIDNQELVDVAGGFDAGAGAALSGAFSMIGQLGAAAINTFGPLIWDTASGGIGSFVQSIMFDGDAPVADGLLGVVKGATNRIKGPVPVNSFTDGQQVKF